MTAPFRDRVDAGRRLVLALAHLAPEHPIVLALPRGGVPVGYEIAAALRAPLDVLVARKLGAPAHRELGIGAIAEGGASYLDMRLVEQLGVTQRELAAIEEEERRELERRVHLYRGDRPPLDVKDRTVILVDDGLATGVTARAAIRSVRMRGPSKIVFAAPVCAPTTSRAILEEIDEVACTASPTALHAVGLWYADFTQTTDDEVLALLDRARRIEPGSKRPSATRLVPAASDRTVRITAGTSELVGDLSIPENARGMVLFVHGSGSSRHSPRNRYVAGELNRSGFATLLIDLLTPDEEQIDDRTRAYRFDIALLADRVVAATDWLTSNVPGLPLAYFGASTGAAAAIVAATRRPDRVSAIVSRGGRPDLAGDALEALRTPTLLVVGGADREVLRLNSDVLRTTQGHARLVIVPRATHLFEEPGALTHVVRFAERWLVQHFTPQHRKELIA